MQHTRKNCFRPLRITIHVSYAIVLALLWCNEIFDLPHTIGLGPKTPVNYFEAILEIFALIIVWIISSTLCTKFLNRIKILEGFLPICSSCKKIRNKDDQWQDIDSYVSEKSEVQFSHSLCPDCLKKMYPDIADEILNESK